MVTYIHYFNLSEAPFSIAPSPRYLFMSPRHQEALAHLLYGLGREGGFILLSGEVGTGKTTICRALLEQIPPKFDVAYIFNPKLTVDELLSTICSEFGIDYPEGNTSIKIFVDLINTHLLAGHAEGRHAVLIIDEAQNLSADVLEQMRLLTNLETSERKLLQIILIGQPELAHLVARPELRQLSQRIIARYHLDALSQDEVADYVEHRLAVAGAQRPLLPRALMRLLHRLTGGVPRLINLVCDRALLGAFVQGKEKVDRKTLLQAAREVGSGRSTTFLERNLRALIVLFVVLILAGLGLAMYQLDKAPAAALAMRQPPPAVPLPVASMQPSTTPVVRPIESGPELPDRISLPALSLAESDREAWSALFKQWRKAFTGADPCREAEALGLACHSGSAGLNEIRALNRPVVLELQAERNRPFHALLLELGAEHAVFSIHGQTQKVALAALGRQWTGRYSLLWRIPAPARHTLRPGERGANVQWLVAQLASLPSPLLAPSQPSLYDEAVVQAVKRFQFEHGLKPDGTFGRQTALYLLGQVDADSPRLIDKPATEKAPKTTTKE